MISYPWKYQEAMKEVKTELESKGLRVWMDVDKMTGNILQTMARAVEKSSVILIAMSREYQNSKYCRSGSFISIAELKQRRRQRHSMNQLITSRFSCDFAAAMLVYRTMAKKVFLGIWFYHHAKLERHFAIVLYTNMAVSSRKWKSRILFSIQAVEYTFKRKRGYYAVLIGQNIQG